mgnify:CR=1 FL=1
MKLKKQLAPLAVMGMMSLAAASSAFAAGVGYVNFDALVQAHKDFPKVSAQMQSAIKDANDKFSKQAPKLKTDQKTETSAVNWHRTSASSETKLVRSY